MSSEPEFCTIEEALAELRQGRMIVLVDDEHRENEGDLVIAAEKVTPEAINFMIAQRPAASSAWPCRRPSATGSHLRAAGRPSTSTRMGTPFTPSIDARTGITTGTSAFDRARTVQVAIDDRARRRPTWSAARATWTACAREPAACWSAPATPRAASTWPAWPGFKEAAVICEIVNADGRMARVPDLRGFCRQHGLKMCTIEDLIKYRRQRERLDPPRAGR